MFREGIFTYGNPISVIKTVKGYECIGVAEFTRKITLLQKADMIFVESPPSVVLE
jgi:hypothetical protein